MKNYIKLFLIILVFVLGVFLLRNFYLNKVDYDNSIPVIRDYINKEINSKEIYNYIREDNDAVIYVGVSSNKLCRSYEEELKRLIVKFNLSDEITYLNLSDLKQPKTFMKEFNKFYDSKLESYPSIIIFKGGKVVDILVIKENMKFYDKTFEFFNDNEIPLGFYD